MVDGDIGVRSNAIQLASWNTSDEMDEIIYFLISKFPDFIKKEEGSESPLSIALNYGLSKRSKRIIEMKHSTNPIYSFLRWSDYLTDEEKLEILKEIEKSYNLAKTIKDDLKQIGEKGKFGDGNVRKNLGILVNYAKSKSATFLEECFGKSFKIDEPITWRFEKDKKFRWVAEEIQKRYKTEKV